MGVQIGTGIYGELWMCSFGSELGTNYEVSGSPDRNISDLGEDITRLQDSCNDELGSDGTLMGHDVVGFNQYVGAAYQVGMGCCLLCRFQLSRHL